MAKYHIGIVRPQGHVHSDGFREVAETLHSALRSLGHVADIGDNTLDSLAVNILLGAHLLSEKEAAALPSSTIVYNLEQLGAATLPSWYMALASRVRIWDYSPLNLNRWKQIPCLEPPVLVEIGFAPELRRILVAPIQDIDVLFYGSLNERRSHILRDLEAKGLKVHHAFGVYGPERDALIARAKIVLNVHFYVTEVFEIVRVSYLLANSKAVVTESSPDLGYLADAVAVFPYDGLVEGCMALVENEAARHTLETHGAYMFAQRQQVEILRHVLLAMSERQATAAPGRLYPRRLNLGSGKDWREDCLNIDVNDYWKPDAVLDISQPLPPKFELATERFGAVPIGPGCFDEILANDVLEHIPNLTKAMETALRLLRPGGVFQIHVPYDLSCGAWQDPTHVRAFNERSWLYYTDWFWYLGWTEARFSIDKLEFIFSAIGERLKGTCTGEDLLRSPRAVDSMRVTLRKQLLSVDELHYVTNYLKRPERAHVDIEAAA